LKPSAPTRLLGVTLTELFAQLERLPRPVGRVAATTTTWHYTLSGE